MSDREEKREGKGNPYPYERRTPPAELLSLVQRFDDLDKTLIDIKKTLSAHDVFVTKVEPVFNAGVWTIGIIFVGMSGAVCLAIVEWIKGHIRWN